MVLSRSFTNTAQNASPPFARVQREKHPRKSTPFWLFVVLMTFSVLVSGRIATAQEFRVYTRVSDLAGAPQREIVIGKSLSLSHAGKVYDLINNGAETEVIIYEPAHDQFVILNTTRNLATTVQFDEVRQKLAVARKETEKRIAELRGMPGQRGMQFVDKLQFSLSPTFEPTLDRRQRSLALVSPFLKYHVRGSEVADTRVAEFYLEYADWIARLNYVLHPHALFPHARMELNRQLRELRWMPIEVELQSQVGAPLHLRAEHEIHWKLDAIDRGLIHDWESLLKSDLVKQVPLAEYQRSLLVGQVRRR